MATDRQRPAAPASPRRATVQFPGGLAARIRWSGSGGGQQIFDQTEAGGALADHGELASAAPDRACRAELRVEGPVGDWTARLASPIYDEPQGLLWDVPGLLVVRYGFRVYAFVARTGDLRWSWSSSTPIIAVLGSSRLPHVIAQAEVETTALRDDGSVAWRRSHSDVVVEAELLAGRLVLTSYGEQRQILDPLTGMGEG